MARVDENSIASAYAAATGDEQLISMIKSKRSKRKGAKLNNLTSMQINMKKTQRDSLWMNRESTKHEYSQTAQERKMQKAAEKRARRSGKMIPQEGLNHERERDRPGADS